MMGDESVAGKSQGRSRRKTPWDGGTGLTPTQEFLRAHYLEHYEARHPRLSETGEAEMINSFVPTSCPYCGCEQFIRRGLTANGIQRYSCSCGQRFLPTTRTIFDGHKISVSEWMEYCLNLFGYVSINADSWNNKNAFSTSQYWLKKLFLTLENSQNSIILSETVWLDETYYPVIASQIDRKEDGTKYRGLSHNQICIGAATDKRNVLCFVEGTGKPSQRKSFQTFSSHIAPGSTLVHDKEAAHRKLVSELSLRSQEYSAKDLKGLKDCDNPLDPVNDLHNSLKKFLNAHSGFNRSNLQDYLNLFAFVRNPPFEPLEKVETLMHLAFHNPKSLRYRDQFGLIQKVDR
jgi:transposase-like protein